MSGVPSFGRGLRRELRFEEQAAPLRRYGLLVKPTHEFEAGRVGGRIVAARLARYSFRHIALQFSRVDVAEVAGRLLRHRLGGRRLQAGLLDVGHQ